VVTREGVVDLEGLVGFGGEEELARGGEVETENGCWVGVFGAAELLYFL
jgi:hypothetical protein